MKICSLLAATLLLAACGTSAPPLYYWDTYPTTIYQGMQGKQSPDAQIGALEQYQEKAKAKNMAVAPGVYAHLGMLYVETGRGNLAQKAFTEEKARFPESAQFMDFLLKTPQPAAQGAAR